MEFEMLACRAAEPFSVSYLLGIVLTHQPAFLANGAARIGAAESNAKKMKKFVVETKSNVLVTEYENKKPTHEMHESCLCEDCLFARAMKDARAGIGSIEVVLNGAWSYAATDYAVWQHLWSLIVRIEGALQEGDVDGHAEDELRAALALLSGDRR
jgi:hypothetical protein